MLFASQTDDQIIIELTKRMRQQRLNLNMTQKELAEKSRLHPQTIKNFEAGKTTSLATFIAIMRVLGDLNTLDTIFPDPGISPIELLKLKGNVRERASGYGKSDDESTTEW